MLQKFNSIKRDKSLSELRDRLDAIDQEIVTLIAKRHEIIKEVAEYKQKKQLRTTDLDREKQVLENCQKTATEHNLDPLVVKEIFALLLKASKNLQNNIRSKL